MKRLTLLAFIFGITVSAYAQITPGIGGKQAAINGRVFGGNEHNPLSDATISVAGMNGAERRTQFTDGMGAFFYFDLPRGRYVVTASHPEYEPRSTTVDYSGDMESEVRIVLPPKRSMATNLSLPSVSAWALQVPEAAQREFSKGIDELTHGKGEKGIPHFEAAVRTYPKYASAWSALGSAQMSAGKLDAASASLGKALEIDPNLVDANFALGSLLRAQKKFDEAETYLLRASAQKNGDGRIHLELAEIYWQRGDWIKAEPSLRIAVRELGQNPRALLLLMNVLALQENYPAALEQMENFLQKFPADPFAPKVKEKHDKLRQELGRTASAKP